MKRIFLSLTGLCLIGCAHTFALPAAPAASSEDTILITMPDKSKMMIYVKNKEDLKKFRNYNVDSLIASLSGYLEATPKPGADTTLTIRSRGAKGGRSTEVQVSVAGNEPPAIQTMTMAMRTLTLQMDLLDKHIALLDQQQKLSGLSAKEKENLVKEKNNLLKEKEVLAKEKDDLAKEIDSLRKESASAAGKKPQAWNIKISEEKVEVSSKEKEVKKVEVKSPPKPWYNEFAIDLGFNTLVNKGVYRNPAGEVIDYDLKPIGSRYVSLNWVTGSRIGGPKSPVRIQSGLEFNFNNFMFDNNLRIANRDNQVEFYKEPELNLNKSKLAVSYLSIPVMAGLKFKNAKGKDSFSFMAGGYAGYRIGSHTKIKYSDADGDTKKSKARGSFNLQDYQYGLNASIGYRSFQVFTKYNLSDLFKEDRGPQAQVINFGITF